MTRRKRNASLRLNCFAQISLETPRAETNESHLPTVQIVDDVEKQATGYSNLARRLRCPRTRSAAAAVNCDHGRYRTQYCTTPSHGKAAGRVPAHRQASPISPSLGLIIDGTNCLQAVSIRDLRFMMVHALTRFSSPRLLGAEHYLLYE